MRRIFKKFFFIITAGVLCLSVCLSGCNSTGNKLKAEGFSLGHFDGSDLSEGYDTDLLYKNNSELWGGDSGTIWVSKEEGEILKERGIVDKNGESYGGYFYQYQSSCGGVASYGLVIDEPNLGRGSVYFVCTRSPDLNDWEICGNVDSGMAMFVGEKEWVQDWTWACEVIHIPFDAKDTSGNVAPYAGKYFMYFSAKTKTWTPELGALGAIYGNVTGSAIGDGMTCGIAVSDSPAGPFRLVSSENVYGEASKAQPVTKDYLGKKYYGVDDGVHGLGVLTGYNPAVMFEKAGEAMGMTDTLTPIDCSPFIDEDGSMYLVFVKHGSSHSASASFAPAQANIRNPRATK